MGYEVSRQPPPCASVQHGLSGSLNPDASRFYAKPDNGGPGRRDENGLGGSLGNAERRRAARDDGHSARNLACNSVVLGHSSGTAGPDSGIRRRGRIGRTVPAGTLRRRVWQWLDTMPWKWHTDPAFRREKAQFRSHGQVRIGTAPALSRATLVSHPYLVVTLHRTVHKDPEPSEPG